MFQFVSGVAAGIIVTLVGGLLSLLFDPVQRRVGSLGRRWFHRAPLQVHIETDPKIIWAGQPPWIGAQVFLPAGGDAGKPPDNPLDWHQWAVNHGGCDAAESSVQITLVGAAPVTVVVENPVVQVSQSQRPHGDVRVRPVGGAEIASRGFDVDLDAFGPSNPIVEDAEHATSPAPARAWSLSDGQVERFGIRVHSESAAMFSWTAILPILVDGERRSIDISNDGEPFVFVGS